MHSLCYLCFASYVGGKWAGEELDRFLLKKFSGSPSKLHGPQRRANVE
jgi:hypothetical protein